MAASTSFPHWILTHNQTGGTGRRARPWVMPKGNFAATLLMFPTEAPQIVALRSFVAALALYDAFVTVSGRADGLSLKWPNDVLLNGGKVAGILLERGERHLSIGIGVNLVAAPNAAVLEEGAVPPVDLVSETGAKVTPEEFLDALAASYAHWEASFATYGFAPIREAWLAKAARIGQPIRARTGTDEFHGTFDTIDAFGNLVLKTSKGTMSIPAAEVSF